jgi:tetratricopeptide (TPR) repeat protein
MVSFATTIGRKNTRMTIDVLGIPPDSAMYLPPSSEKEDAVYTFDQLTVPMLYFYNSPSSLLLLTNQKKTVPEMLQQIEHALAVLAREPATRFNQVLKYTALTSHAQTSAQDKDHLDLAIADLIKANRLGLKFSSGYALLANAYRLQGDRVKARDATSKALEINPRAFDEKH